MKLQEQEYGSIDKYTRLTNKIYDMYDEINEESIKEGGYVTGEGEIFSRMIELAKERINSKVSLPRHVNEDTIITFKETIMFIKDKLDFTNLQKNEIIKLYNDNVDLFTKQGVKDVRAFGAIIKDIKMDLPIIVEFLNDYVSNADSELYTMIISDSKDIILGKDKFTKFEYAISNLFPSWNVKKGIELIEFEQTKQEEPDEEFEAGKGLKNETIEWEKVDMEKGLTIAVKNFLSGLFYKDNKGNKRRINPRYAFFKLMEVMEGINLGDPAAIEQLRAKMEGQKDVKMNAIVDKLTGLISTADNGLRNQIEDDELTNMWFQSENKFYISTKGLDIWKHVANADDLELAIPDIEVYTRNKSESTNSFVNRIRTRLSTLVKEDGKTKLYTEAQVNNMVARLWEQMKAQHVLIEMSSSLGSMSRLNIRIAEIKLYGSTRYFRYIKGKDLSIVDRLNASINNAIVNKMKNNPHAIRTAIAIATIDSHKDIKVDEGKTWQYTIVKSILHKLGLEDYTSVLINTYDTKYKQFSNNEAQEINIEYAEFIREFAKIDTRKLGTDKEKAKNQEGEPDKYDVYDLIQENGFTFNRLYNLLVANADTLKPTTVLKADGSRIFQFMASSKSRRTLMRFITGAATGRYKNGNNRGATWTLPKWLDQERYKKNIYASGKGTIYSIEDHMGNRKQWSSGESVKDYKAEKGMDYFTRAFSMSFLSELLYTGNSKKYVQPFYTTSNKTLLKSVSVKALDTKEIKDALKLMLEQIQSRPETDNVNIRKYERSSTNGFKILAYVTADMYPELRDIDGAEELNNIHAHIEKMIDKGTLVSDTLVEALYNKLHKTSLEVWDRVVKEELDFPSNLNKISKSNVIKNLVDDKLYPNWKADKLKDAETNTFVFKDKDKKYKTQYVKDILEPLWVSYFMNDYIQSNQLAWLQSGDPAYYATGENQVKRESIVHATGLVGDVGSWYSAKPKYKAAVAEDIVTNMGDETANTLSEMCKKAFKNRPDKEKLIDKYMDYYGKAKATLERTNAQSYHLPERASMLRRSFGSNYVIGNVVKDIIHDITDEGHVFSCKNSSIELTDSYIYNHPKWHNVRSAMRYNGLTFKEIQRATVIEELLMEYNLNTKVNNEKTTSLKIELADLYNRAIETRIEELHHPSGVEVGVPKKLIDMRDILYGNRIFSKDDVIDLNSEAYLLQFNPINSTDSDNQIFTQLLYFLNILETNQDTADAVYNALNEIYDDGFALFRSKIENKDGNIDNKKLRDFLRATLDGKGNERLYEMFVELKTSTPWEMPMITDNALIQFMSRLAAHTNKIRFKGTGMILQTAEGIEILDLDKKDGSKRELKIKFKDTGEGQSQMYAEVLIGRGVLTQEEEETIDEVNDYNKAVYEYKVHNNKDYLQLYVNKYKTSLNLKELKYKDFPEFYTTPDLFAYRIPSSEFQSAMALKVVGFRDDSKTNIIVAPWHLLVLHGSNFDSNRLFVIERERMKDKIVIKSKDSTLTVDNNLPVGYSKGEDGKLFFDDSYKQQIEKWLLEYKGTEHYRTFIELKKVYNKNFIVEQMIKTIISEENRLRMLKPINMSIIKEVGSEVKDMKPKSSLRRYGTDLSNVDDRFGTHQLMFGQLEVSKKVFQLLQSISFIWNSRNNTRVFLNNTFFSFDNNKYFELQTSEDIYEKYSNLYNNKEIDLYNLQITQNSVIALFSLLIVGVPLQNAILLLNQPLVRKYVNHSQKNFYEVTNQINKMFLQLIEQDKNIFINNPHNNITTDELRANINIELQNCTLKQFYQQYCCLAEYKKAFQIGCDLLELNNLTTIPVTFKFSIEKIDKVLKTFFDYFQLNSKHEIITKSNFPFAVSNIFHFNTHVERMLEILLYVKHSFLNNKVFKYSKNTTSFIDKVIQKMNIQIDKRTLINSFVHFVLTKMIDTSKEVYKRLETKKYVKYTNKEAFNMKFYDKLLALEIFFQKKENEYLLEINGIKKDFMNYLELKKNKLRFVAGTNLQPDEEAEIQYAFKTLNRVDIVENEKSWIVQIISPTQSYNQLQFDFIKYSVLNNGLRFGGNNYNSFLPVDLLTDTCFDSTGKSIENKIMDIFN